MKVKKLNEGTGNFYIRNRCVVVTDEDYEDGNVPETHGSWDNDRNFSSSIINDDFLYGFVVILTAGYYSGANIDYDRKEDVSVDISNYSPTFEGLSDLYHDLDYITTDAFGGEVESLILELKELLDTYEYLEDDDKESLENMQQLFKDIYKKLKDSYEKGEGEEESKVNEYIDKLKEDYGYEEYSVSARFSNGETMYSKIDKKESTSSGSLAESILKSLSKFEFKPKINSSQVKSPKKKLYESSKSKSAFVEYLNEIGIPDDDLKSNGGRISDRAKYGDWLRKNDPIAFNVGYSDWSRDN